MRQSTFHSKTEFLRYEIREIVAFVEHIQKLDPELKVENQNIGDPIARGWHIPPLLKELIYAEIEQAGDKVFGYTHSYGAISTRKWIVDYAKRFSPESDLTYDHVVITSGLGAAISILYQMLPQSFRVIQPSPSYPTHTSFEAFSTGEPALTYELDPYKNWEPNLKDLEEKIKKNPLVSAILVINPNNPTGAVYGEETLRAIVDLAEKYKLMILADEIYFRLVYNGHTFTHISSLAQHRVPLIVMRGLSKDVPWPGGRCGWLEFHNVYLDEDFEKYVSTVKRRILLEVCATTLPQFLLPKIYEHPDFEPWLESYKKHLEGNSRKIAAILSRVNGLKVNPTNGAFYMMPVFEGGVLNERQALPIINPNVKTFVEQAVSSPNIALDKRFIYFLLASTGICAVPATSFNSKHFGFRVTTLDKDPDDLERVYTKLAEATEQYLSSST